MEKIKTCHRWFGRKEQNDNLFTLLRHIFHFLLYKLASKLMFLPLLTPHIFTVLMGTLNDINWSPETKNSLQHDFVY
jgi:hypothetical protein